jgi:tetratricopeptide (TPR) repeat protein
MSPTTGRLPALLAAMAMIVAARAEEAKPVEKKPTTTEPAAMTAFPAPNAPTTPATTPAAGAKAPLSLPEQLIAQSEQHYLKREYIEAIRCLETALQFAPNDARAVLEDAQARDAAGDAAGALLAHQEAFRRFPPLVTIFTGLGLVRNETGDYYGALKDFTTAIDLWPIAYLAYSGRAEAKAALDDYAGAIEDLSVQIRAAHPELLDRTYLSRGQMRLVLGELAGASEDFAAAIKINPKIPLAYLLRAYALKDTGGLPEALASLDEAVKLAPDFARAYSARSWVHHELGHTEAALADADKAVALQADAPDYVLNRAMLLDMLEQRDRARTDYERAITLAEGKDNNLVWFYAEFHLDLQSRQHDGKPKDAYLADVLTWPDCWQKRIGMFLSGRIDAESLIKDAEHAKRRPERNNQECEAYYFIAMARLLAGDKEAARKYFEQCVATNDLQTVELGLARLQLRRLQAAVPAPVAQ